MARTAQEESPTKDKLLDAAQALVLAKGFAATTVDDICASAGLTKGSFFHYFESKDVLGQELLERYCRDARARHDALFGDDTDPLKRIYHYLDTTAEAARSGELKKGCLLGSFAQELADENKGIRETCAKAFAGWAGRFAGELSLAKAKHAPRAKFDPDGVAEHFVAIMEGAALLCKTQQDCAVIGRSLKHFKAYVQSLFGA